MDFAPWTFCVRTFGCKVNQYEAQSLREAWKGMNGRETDAAAEADMVLLNTCAVTANAVADARQAVYKLQREAPESRIVITGCAAGAARAELGALPGVAAVVGQMDKALLLEMPPLVQLDRLNGLVLRKMSGLAAGDMTALRDAVQKERAAAAAAGAAEDRTAGKKPGPDYPPFRIGEFRRSRPVLKVQDGCSHGCAFCIVPLTRGPARSRAPLECLEEVQRLIAAGYREIMLSGINLRLYRSDESGVRDFWDLVSLLDRELAPRWSADNTSDPVRLRISSVDPAQLNRKGLDCLAASRLVCHHLHISLQSGSQSVLRGMRRGHYTAEALLDAVQAVRSFWHRLGLGADILMGFPGETEEHVRETLDVVAKMPLTYAHVFPFSSRPGTVAAAMANQVPQPERHSRAARVRALVEQKKHVFWEQSLSETALLVALDNSEEKRGQGMHGIDDCYVPCRLASPISGSRHGLVKVRPLSLTAKGLLVEPLSVEQKFL